MTMYKLDHLLVSDLLTSVSDLLTVVSDLLMASVAGHYNSCIGHSTL